MKKPSEPISAKRLLGLNENLEIEVAATGHKYYYWSYSAGELVHVRSEIQSGNKKGKYYLKRKYF